MAGLIPLGQMEAASDLTTASLVATPTVTRDTLDVRYVRPADVATEVSEQIAGMPGVEDAAVAAVSNAVGGMSLTKTDVLITNHALNPVPTGNVTGWVSENTGLYTVALGPNEAVVTRTATTPSTFRAVVRVLGMLTSGMPTFAAGAWTASVEVWSDTPARTVAYGAYPAVRIPAKIWTRVYGAFTSTGAAAYHGSIAVAEATGSAPTGAVTKFRNVMYAPGTVHPRAGNGADAGWQWNGTPGASTSSGLPVTTATVQSDLAGLRGGVRVVPLGDSTTIANSTVAPNWGGRDFWAWGHILSGGAFKYVRNAGIAGDRTADMLARFDSDVTPYAPNVVPIVGGINDAVSTTVSLAQYQTNIRALVAKVRGIGAKPWLGNVSPNLNTGAVQQMIARYNAWLKEYAATESIPLIDINAILTDPADGKILPAYDLDGTHQNVAGGRAIGAAIAAVAASNLPAWVPNLPTSNTADSMNLLPNGLFLVGSPVATGWVNSGGVPTLVADATIKGNWQRLTESAAGTATFRCDIGMGSAVAGDVLNFAGRIRQVKGTTVGYARLFVTFAGPNVVHEVLYANTEDCDGIFSISLPVPAGATGIQVQLARVVTAAGTGYTQLAQVGLFNQTALGSLS